MSTVTDTATLDRRLKQAEREEPHTLLHWHRLRAAPTEVCSLRQSTSCNPLGSMASSYPSTTAAEAVSIASDGFTRPPSSSTDTTSTGASSTLAGLS